MLKQSSMLFLAKVVGFGIRLLLPIFLVRIMSKAEIGAYNQFFLIETLIQTVFQLGVNQSQFFFIPRDPKNAGGYFLNSIILNLVLFTFGYALIGLFRNDLSAWLGLPVLTRFFWHLTAYSILMLLNVSSQVFLTARREFKHAAIFDISRQVLASIATLVAAYLTRSLEAIVLALVLSRFVSLVLGLLFVHYRHHAFRSERYFLGIWDQVRYGVVLGVAGTLGTLMMRLHELAVSKYYSIETFAVYAQGLKQIPILLFFTQSISEVALVRFAQLEKDGDWAGIRKFWNEVLGAMYAVGIPITVVFVVVANPLIRLMYTDAYMDAAPIFQINALAMLFNLINPTLVLRAMDRNDLTLKINLVTVVLLPPALYAGMHLFGLKGVIAAHGVMLLGSRVVLQIILNRIAPVSMPLLPPRQDILSFYGKSWQTAKKMLSGAAGR